MSSIGRVWLGVVAVTLLTSLGLAHALTVFDPSNFSKNIVTASSSVRTEINTATSAIQSIRQTIELVKSTASLDGVARLAGLQEELGLYRSLVDTNRELRDAVDQSRTLYDNLSAQYGASNFSWKAFLQGRATGNLQQAQMLLNKYESVNRAIASTNSRRENLLQAVQNATGETAATQGLSAQIDILIGQNQQVMSLLATQVAQNGMDKKESATKSQQESNEYQNYQLRLERAANRFKQ